MKKKTRTKPWVKYSSILLAVVSVFCILLLFKPISKIISEATGINVDELESWAVTGLSMTAGLTLCVVAITFATIPIVGVSIAIIGVLSLAYSSFLLYERLNQPPVIKDVKNPRL